MEDFGASGHTFFYNLSIIISVPSGLALILECVVLTILICVKAYKMVLQRIFLWILLAMIILDTTRASAVGHHSFPDNSGFCELLGIIQPWSEGCVYLFLLVLLGYLLFLVSVRIRGNPPIIDKLKNSKSSRLILEVGIVLGAVAVPWLILWVPYHDRTVEYGFNGYMCGLAHSSCNCNDTSYIRFVINGFTGPVLTGLVAVTTLFGIAALYCTMSSILQRLHPARRLIIKLVISLLVVTTLQIAIITTEVLVETIATQGTDEFLAVLSLNVLIINSEKMTLTIGYLLVFHYSEVCGPLKRLTERMKKEQTQGYGTFSKTRSTHFTIPFTDGFSTSRPQE